MKDYVVIEIFVDYLRGNGYPDLCIDQKPDKENRQSKDIDAIAGPFAIEHTSIDTLPNQRGKSDWFMRVVGGLELPIPLSRLIHEGMRRPLPRHFLEGEKSTSWLRVGGKSLELIFPGNSPS